ncbi:MAG TPA: GNAT family N-acetyltransferase [Afipia sp.]
MLADDNGNSAFSSLARFSDVLRLRNGQPLVVRFIVPQDGEELQSYFKTLTQRSRYNRFMGAASELPPAELDTALHSGRQSRFAVVAEVKAGDVATIVGEARYSYDAATREVEFGLSVADDWQQQGVGSQLLANLECRAAALGALRMFGETFRNNEQMIGLAKKSSFGFDPAPHDWRLVRFSKTLPSAAEDIPCENWKRAAVTGSLAEALVEVR